MHQARSACKPWQASSCELCAMRSLSPPCSASSTPRVPFVKRRMKMWYGLPCSGAQGPSGWHLSCPPGPTEALALFRGLSTASGPPLRPRSRVASSLLYLNGPRCQAQSHRLKHQHRNLHPAQPQRERRGGVKQQRLLALRLAHRRKLVTLFLQLERQEWISESFGSFPWAVFLLVREVRPQK